MDVSLSWLKSYVAVEMTPADLSSRLTMAGLEVEQIVDRYQYLDTVLVGRVTRIEPHPNADRLKLCTVEAGAQNMQVVCGAPNVEVDKLYPLALTGTVFPDGTVLREGKIRGEVSAGMLCSEAELKLGPDTDGILVLSNSLPPGQALNKALNLSDPVFEIDLTPNRSDCLGIFGIAREVAAFGNGKVQYPQITLPKEKGDAAQLTSVTIEAPDLCPRYAARLVFDVVIGPSPQWLQDRLFSVGLKPINNIVDITNFVMLETGQPLHAFDYDRLAGNRIVVRSAGQGEKFTTLDGKARELAKGMLLICDAEEPVALAGVMGGLNSEIGPETTRVLIESAHFNPVSIRKTAKKLGLMTDASHRFERGVDPNGVTQAADRAAQLMLQTATGYLPGGIIDVYPKPVSENEIVLDVEMLNRRLGTQLGAAEVMQFLAAIEMRVSPDTPGKLRVTVPTYRMDINRFEDLCEEVARLYGYNRIDTTFPAVTVQSSSQAPVIAVKCRMKRILSALGFQETINYSFIDSRYGQWLRMMPGDDGLAAVEILNPISKTQSVLRTSLVPSLLETMRHNISLKNLTLKLFEIGRVFFAGASSDQQPQEKEMVAGLWTGMRYCTTSWHAKDAACDYYDLKGSLESFFKKLCIKPVTFTRMRPEACSYLQPGHAATICIGADILGYCGRVHSQVAATLKLKQAAYIFELNLDTLIAHLPDQIVARPLAKFPATARDVTLILKREIEAQEVLQHLERKQEPLIEAVDLFDVYEGSPIDANKKSISFRVTYRSSVETLADDRINHLHKEVTNELVQVFGAGLPA